MRDYISEIFFKKEDDKGFLNYDQIIKRFKFDISSKNQTFKTSKLAKCRDFLILYTGNDYYKWIYDLGLFSRWIEDNILSEKYSVPTSFKNNTKKLFDIITESLNNNFKSVAVYLNYKFVNEDDIYLDISDEKDSKIISMKLNKCKILFTKLNFENYDRFINHIIKNYIKDTDDDAILYNSIKLFKYLKEIFDNNLSYENVYVKLNSKMFTDNILEFTKDSNTISSIDKSDFWPKIYSEINITRNFMNLFSEEIKNLYIRDDDIYYENSLNTLAQVNKETLDQNNLIFKQSNGVFNPVYKYNYANKEYLEYFGIQYHSPFGMNTEQTDFIRELPDLGNNSFPNIHKLNLSDDNKNIINKFIDYKKKIRLYKNNLNYALNR
jgi:hypothetical protein